MGNTEENPFLFVNTTAMKISRILPVYFDDVHDIQQKFKTC